MGSWTAGARAPCRRGRAGPGCSVSVSTPPPCTASPLTRAAGPPSRPSQPLGRPPVQSPLRGCTDTLPAACPQHRATTPFLCNCYRPLWPHSEQLVYTAAERGPWTTLFRSWILLASNPRSANAVQPSGSSQPCTVSPRCSSRTGQRAAGRGRALREPRFLCPSPSRGLLLALQTPCRRALPRGGALAWPAGTPCAPARCLAASAWATSGLSSGPASRYGPRRWLLPSGRQALCESRGLAALCLQGLAPRKRSVTLK